MADEDWWRGAVIYQIYPRSYMDKTGDGVGDLRGITARLEHAASLGVDAIWISPFFTSPMKDMGYDIADPCDVDPIFGTLDDFDTLLGRAHELGLKVMIDQVFSHHSDQHPWFKESRKSRDNPKADWYVWSDPAPGGGPPNNWQAVFGGASWTWVPARRQYFMHNFLDVQPQLNFHNPDVRRATLDQVRFWLDRGVDGFRLDSVNYHFHDDELRDNPAIDPGDARSEAPAGNTYGYQAHDYDKTRPENLAFLQELRTLLDSYDARATVGEVGDGARSLPTMAEYTRHGRLNMAYSFELLGDEFSPRLVAEKVQNFERECHAGDSWACWAFSNHDVPRHVSRWSAYSVDRPAFAKLTAGLLLSLKGSVCLYQGEELGLPEADLAFEEITDPKGKAFWPEEKGRDGCRTPMPWEAEAANAGFSLNHETWLPIKAPHPSLAVDRQDGVAGSVLEFYRGFLAFRKGRPSLVTGEIAFRETEGDVLCFERYLGEERTLCVFNLCTSPVAIDVPEGATWLSAGFAAPEDGRLGVHGAAFYAL